MSSQLFSQLCDERVAKYNLLHHPWYQAWTEGKLTLEDLRFYSTNYYHHVGAFPDYLRLLLDRLAPGKLHAAVSQHRAEELGGYEEGGRNHGELWLDFACAVGAERSAVPALKPVSAVESATTFFSQVAESAEPVEAMAAFWAYESQVPAVSEVKAKALTEYYSIDSQGAVYFTTHAVADIEHGQSWKALIDEELERKPELLNRALDAAEAAAQKLWAVLDAFQERRQVLSGV